MRRGLASTDYPIASSAPSASGIDALGAPSGLGEASGGTTCLGAVSRYAHVVRTLHSMDSLSRELEDYSKNERAFLCATVLGAENLRRISPTGSIPAGDALLASLRDHLDVAQRFAIAQSRLTELCERRLPRLIDIALRNEDITHYESMLHADLKAQHRDLSSSALAEKVFQSPEYFEMLRRANIANCRECSNAIAGILSREHPSLRVATVASTAHDHQFVLAGTRLPYRLEDMRDLEPDTVVVDPWKGTFGLALDAFLARDAFKNGYVLPLLKYTNLFYDPLRD